MCKLRDDTMSQAGELPMDFRTNVEKELEKKMEDQGMFNVPKDLSGVAVRGEAVAIPDSAITEDMLDDEIIGLPCNWRGDPSQFMTISLGHTMACEQAAILIAKRKLVQERAPVSPRAADAPSEPSELATRQNAELVLRRLEQLHKDSVPGSWRELIEDAMPCQLAVLKAVGGEVLGDIPKNVSGSDLTRLARRLRGYVCLFAVGSEPYLDVRSAADALDSQKAAAWMKPLNKECTSAESKAMMEVTETGLWKEVAKQYSVPLYLHPVALDSQPTVLAYVATDLDGRADVGMTREKAMERAGHGCDTIIPVYDLGNSQPAASASQESIGDDAAFRTLVSAYSANTTKGNFDAIVRFLDSRAPAAQAGFKD